MVGSVVGGGGVEETEVLAVPAIVKRILHNNFSGLFFGLPFTKPNPDFVQSVKTQFSPESKLLLFCQEGLRSVAAARKLEGAGYQDIACITSGLQSVKPGEFALCFRNDDIEQQNLSYNDGTFDFVGSTELQNAGKARLVTGWAEGRSTPTKEMHNIVSKLFLLAFLAAPPMAAANHGGSAGGSIIRSTCAATLYPELCISTVELNLPTAAVESSRDVLAAALDHTIRAVERNRLTIRKSARLISSNPVGLPSRALNDCLEMAELALDELRAAANRLENLEKSRAIDDVLTYLSAAMANQLSCVDGLPPRGSLARDHMHVFRLVSNLLVMVRSVPGRGALGRWPGRARWPDWLSDGDRRMLVASEVTPNVTVAADGSGDYVTVGEAVEIAPHKSDERYIVRIKSGVYRENVEIPSNRWNMMFVGDGEGETNTAGPSNHQAVALRVSADFSAFHQCTMSAYQDTLYTHSLRQFYSACTIFGTVDFIFDRGAAVLQDCDIWVRRPNPGQRNMVTADGRADPGQNTGIVIQGCRIQADNDLRPVQAQFPTYLGRPWGQYARTVVMQTEISDVVWPEGWYRWNNSNYGLNTCFFAEYENTGDGANTSHRVTWHGFRVLAGDEEAEPFTAAEFIAGGEWLPDTGFPFSLGL
ncbi:plant invertase/pectin methylesterase inhibitor [Striga asiatica]|uniref:Pectinesterase n=1 Tax=Striga asiatica TaxID=4170 RepID=A0A5A7PTF5_STRAF|nr:plant invertase/pectin methylesterase inhibitor [Striga asiatica]